MSGSVLEKTNNQSVSSTQSARPRMKHSTFDSMVRYAKFLGYGDFHTKIDHKTGLTAIVAIHNLNRGPAIGGCRMVPYQAMEHAFEDALRLGHMMSYKAAINNLPHGGAKAVIVKPAVIKDREAFFEAFGEFVDELGGRYITAVDSGTSPREMDIIARKTKFVTCTSKSGADSDPSPLTALGVRRAIEAAIKFKRDKDNLEGVHVTIQGAGHVGYYLAEELHKLGARLTMTDINKASLDRCVQEFGVSVCQPDEIYDIKADVFAPCALGAVLNGQTIKRLRTEIVAGSANNQLSHRKNGELLADRGILYAPDFLINAGGLIHVAVMYGHGDFTQSKKQITDIYNTVYDIYETAARENQSTNYIAERIARERLGVE